LSPNLPRRSRRVDSFSPIRLTDLVTPNLSPVVIVRIANVYAAFRISAAEQLCNSQNLGVPVLTRTDDERQVVTPLRQDPAFGTFWRVVPLHKTREWCHSEMSAIVSMRNHQRLCGFLYRVCCKMVQKSGLEILKSQDVDGCRVDRRHQLAANYSWVLCVLSVPRDHRWNCPP
jgi:hypothetical protein